jgi:hypothetical protein
MTMHNDEDRMERLLKQSLPPTEAQAGANLQRDLWPAMLDRLGETSSAVPWFDWALLVALVVWLTIFPQAIPVLLYHL